MTRTPLRARNHAQESVVFAGSAWTDFIARQSFVDALRVRWEFLRFRYDPKVRDACARHVPVLLDWAGVPRRRDENEPLPWAPANRSVVERMTDALIAEAAHRRPPLRPPEAVVDCLRGSRHELDSSTRSSGRSAQKARLRDATHG